MGLRNSIGKITIPSSGGGVSPVPPIPPAHPPILDDGNSRAWYEAKEEYLVFDSGIIIEQWNDKSGNGYHLFQPTPGLSWLPDFVADSVDFDAVGNQIEELTIVQAMPFTVYIVVNARSWRFFNDIIDFASNIEIEEPAGGYAPGFIPLRLTEGAGVLNGSAANRLPEGSFGLLTAVFDGANSYLQVNDNVPDVGGTMAGALPATRIIVSHIGIDSQFKEIIFRAGHETAPNIAIIQDWLNDKYTLY